MMDFLGRPRFLLPSLRPLASSLARRGLGDDFTVTSAPEVSSSPPDSCQEGGEKKRKEKVMCKNGTEERNDTQ